MLKKRVGEVGDGRRAVHHADLLDLDELGWGEIAVRAVGEERRHPDEAASCALAPEKLLIVPSARKKAENSPLVLR